MEYTFEDWLHGTNGTARVTRTSSGTITSTVYTEDPVPGNHVYLTIDIQLQEAVERILETGIYELQLKRDEDNAKYTMEGQTRRGEGGHQGGAIVVVDVKTGEPLAIASYPTFDLSSIIEDYSDLLEAENDPLFNRALNGAYAPGSTFKPCTAIAGLTENIINTETQIECTGLFTKYADQGYAPACWIYTQTDGQLTHGYDNVTEAIKDSCNFFLHRGRQPRHTQADGVRQELRLRREHGHRALGDHRQHGEPGQPPQLRRGPLGGRRHGSGRHRPVRQHVHAAAARRVLRRHRQRRHAPLRRHPQRASAATTTRASSIRRRRRSSPPLDSADYNWAAVQRGMYLMANDITSSSSTVYYALSNYSYNGVSLPVAAKTGTSQLGEDKTNNAIFMCYAPFDDPEIAIAIVVERGQSGANLSKMARNVLDAYFSLGTLNTTAEREYSLLK